MILIQFQCFKTINIYVIISKSLYTTKVDIRHTNVISDFKRSHIIFIKAV
jgi:hypothetical protein